MRQIPFTRSAIRYLGFCIIGILFATENISAQTVYSDYFDGEVYVKIADNIPYEFDKTKREVDFRRKLGFLSPYINTYKIIKVDAEFYFANNETLERTFRIYFQSKDLIDQFISDLEYLEQVEYAEKVPLFKTEVTPNDLFINTGGQPELAVVFAQSAWDITTGSPSVVIAVVDNAVDITHVDLASKVVASRDVSDNDNDPNPPPATPNSNFDHGTHCAGIAAGATNNTWGMASLGWGCSLMAIKAEPNNGTDTTISNGLAGITWAVTNGADIISCSFAGVRNNGNTFQNVLDQAYDSSIVVVASAGNSNALLNNGNDNVLVVASVNILGFKSAFSNFGSIVDISAPGESILSCLPSGNWGDKSGTSMATPMVAALCGLIKSRHPMYSVDDIVHAVKIGATNINSQNPGFIGQLGAGMINAYNSVYLPCNGSVNLGNSSYSNLHTESSGIITSSNDIPLVNHSVIFDAAVKVSLQPGFSTAPGTTFKAIIDGCGGSQKNTIENGPTDIVNQIKIYPNPFIHQTTIELEIIEDNSIVTIEIFDLIGKRVASLAHNEVMSPGKHLFTFQVDQRSGNFFLARIKIGEREFLEKIVRMD